MHTRTRMHARARTHICTHTHIYTHTRTSIHTFFFTHTYTQAHAKIDARTYTQTHTQTYTYTHRHTHKQTHIHTDRHTDTNRITDRWTDGWTDGRTHTQTDTYTLRETHIHKHIQTQTDTDRNTLILRCFRPLVPQSIGHVLYDFRSQNCHDYGPVVLYGGSFLSYLVIQMFLVAMATSSIFNVIVNMSAFPVVLISSTAHTIRSHLTDTSARYYDGHSALSTQISNLTHVSVSLKIWDLSVWSGSRRILT